MKTWSTVDKTSWGDGPWMTEPDKAVWVDQVTGLDCMIHRGSILGALCGYVGVGPGHPFHGRDVDAMPGAPVHWGINYSAACMDTDDESHGICHVPEPGRPHDVWWLGFDCGRAGDFSPAMDARTRGLGAWSDRSEWETYRPFGFVRDQVEKLAVWLFAHSVTSAGR